MWSLGLTGPRAMCLPIASSLVLCIGLYVQASFLLHVVDCVGCQYCSRRLKRYLCLHFPLGKFMEGFGPALIMPCLQIWWGYVAVVGTGMWKRVTVTGDHIRTRTEVIGRGAVFKVTEMKVALGQKQMSSELTWAILDHSLSPNVLGLISPIKRPEK